MESISDGASVITEDDDRISNLPDDIIHHILSFLDLKYAVQTSALSLKWKHLWTLMPQLNLNSDTFDSLHRFGKFAAHALSNRNSLTEVSTLTLKFRGSLTRPFVTDIVNYAYLRNLKQLTLWHNGTAHELPQCLFVSRTLKHVTLVNPFAMCRSCTPNSAWDFPALETLNLTCIRLGDGSEKNLNLFYKCVNLKDVTLHQCSMKGLEVFNVCAPHLSSFTITEASVLPKVLNMVTPQLETLTASASVAICSEGLAASSNFLRLCLEGFNALEKVNISMSNSRLRKERHVPSLLELFRTLRTVKFLILDVDVIESLSSCLDQLSGEPCPFDNLKCLKINTTPTQLKQRDCIPTIPTQVRKYFLENSPNATFIMDLPQVYLGPSLIHCWRGKKDEQHSTTSPNSDPSSNSREVLGRHHHSSALLPKTLGESHDLLESRQQVDSDPVTKVAKLEAENKLPQTTAEETRMQEAKTQWQDQLTAQQKARIPMQSQVNGQQTENIRMKYQQLIAKRKEKFQKLVQLNEYQMKKIRMQDEVIAQQKAKIQTHDQIIAQYKTMYRAKIKRRDRLVAKQKETYEAKMQTQDQVIAKLKARLAAESLQYEKLTSQIIKCKMAELKAQVESGNPDYEVIRLVGRDVESAMDLMPQSLRARAETEFSFQYEMLKCRLLTRVDASQWERIETGLGNIRLSERFSSSHSHSQSHVHAAELPAAPRVSPANMTAFSRVTSAGTWGVQKTE
ncbi:putative F-box domain, leucine-rich repeat domain superfamily, F-box-like domain superfamily [Helianthus annuus]|nr:putative F-box domain, leucine-rich repeat domain superfamily, F-box-like domain superfamily [Helianthus annuus]